MNRLLIALLGLLLVAHQDVWNWETLAWFGPLPRGFVYHLTYCVAVSVVMWLLVRHQRPAADKGTGDGDDG